MLIGILVAIVLWWSDFLSKVSEPFLVVLNSLPKVALGPIIIIWVGARQGCNYNYGDSNCDGGLMTTNGDEPVKASNTAKKWYSSDGQALANLFSKLKENDNINKKIELKVDRVPKDIPKLELKDFTEQMIYFRKRLGYTQKQAGKAIDVSEDTYRRYELREVEMLDSLMIFVFFYCYNNLYNF